MPNLDFFNDMFTSLIETPKEVIKDKDEKHTEENSRNKESSGWNEEH